MQKMLFYSTTERAFMLKAIFITKHTKQSADKKYTYRMSFLENTERKLLMKCIIEPLSWKHTATGVIN